MEGGKGGSSREGKGEALTSTPLCSAGMNRVTLGRSPEEPCPTQEILRTRLQERGEG